MRDLHSYRCHRSGLTFSPEYHWSSGSNADPDPANELTMKDGQGLHWGKGQLVLPIRANGRILMVMVVLD